MGVKAKWLAIIPIGLKFVSSQGRMKFTRPVYRYKFINNRKHCYLYLNFILFSRDLFNWDLFNWDESKQKAIENFKAQREFMHQTTAALVAKFYLYELFSKESDSIFISLTFTTKITVTP